MSLAYDLCVSTPTHNCAYCPEALLDSLYIQRSSRFSWLIADDGPAVNAGELVRSFAKRSPIPIFYYRQSNGRKHRTFNTRIHHYQSELFMCIAPDDALVDNTVEEILSHWVRCAMIPKSLELSECEEGVPIPRFKTRFQAKRVYIAPIGKKDRYSS